MLGPYVLACSFGGELNQQSSSNHANESERIARLEAEKRETQNKLDKAEMDGKRMKEELRQVC